MYELNLSKKIYIVVYKFLFQLVYNISSFLRKDDENKIIIALYRTDKLEGNLKYVYQEILNQVPKAKIHLVKGKNKMNLSLFKEIIMISNARYVILDDYYLPIYLVNLKTDLKVIQLWHAASAMKKFGYSSIGTKFGSSCEYLRLVPIHSNYTHVYISAAKFKKYYAEAFNMNEEKIHSLGIPRVDLFRDKILMKNIKNGIYQNHPTLDKGDYVNILIAPTYRAKGSYGESKLELIDSIIAISNALNYNINIIFKPHPYMEVSDLNRLKKCSNVVIASSCTINEWMLVSDAFITDYSSAIFDFSLLERPMAHYIPDYGEYKHNRGLYQDIQVVSSGTILKDPTELKQWINARMSNEYFDSTSMVNYNFDNTNNVAQQIVRHFISA